MNLQIRELQLSDAEGIAAAFAAIGWSKPAAQYQRYYREQVEGRSTTLVAASEGRFAGYVKLSWRSDYPSFRDEGIPEIQDLNVLPPYRRQGIASQLLERAEALAATRSDRVGIAVGLHPGYNAAQRLYILRGYVPDARGVTWKGAYIQEYQPVVADDELLLHLVKELETENR